MKKCKLQGLQKKAAPNKKVVPKKNATKVMVKVEGKKDIVAQNWEIWRFCN